MIIAFSLRRLLRHLSLNLPVLLGLTLASALLAGMPAYADMTAEWSLQQSFVNSSPAGRNIEINADPSVMTGALNGYIMETIGGLVQSRLTVQKTTISADHFKPVRPIDSSERLSPNELTLWSFDQMAVHFQLIEGNWPEYSRPYTQEEIMRAMLHPPPIQAVISKDSASQTGIRVGDTLVDADGINYPIVGIIEPVDAENDIWWGDLSPFHIVRQPGTNEDTIFLSLIIDPTALQEYFPEYTRSWRLLVDHGQITPETSQFWEEELLSFKALIQADRAQMSSNLPDLLLNFRSNQATIRMVLLLLGSQSFIFVLYTLALIASSVLERTQSEISTMVGRGASSWQLVRMLAIEGGYMAILAGFALGPLVSVLALNGWASVTGGYHVSKISVDTLYYSLIGAGLGWISLMLGTIPLVRRNILDWQRKLSRAERSSRWTKLYLDVFLLIFGGIIFWQLSSSRSFVIGRMREIPLADPLLLLSPTILLVAISLILLRIFPYLLQGIAWLVRSMRGLVLPLGLSRLARNPIRPNQIALLIGAAFGLMLFMTTYDTSLTFNQRELAHYQTGADLRITQGNQSVDDLVNLPGVLQASRVLRLRISTTSGSAINLFALDSQTFAHVAYYPEGMTSISMDSITQVLRWERAQGQPDSGNNSRPNPFLENPDPARAIPAIYSQAALPANKGVGDTLQILVQGIPVDFSVRGVIFNFPTLTNSFILVDISALQSFLDLQTSTYHNKQEIWLATDPAQHDALVTTLSQDSTILADAQAELQRIQNNAFTEGGRRAFTLNAYTLAVLSIIGFLLLNYFSAQQRRFEFGILRASGMSIVQIIALLVNEGMLTIIMGLTIGLGIGFGLVGSMRIFLNTALEKTFPGAVVYQITLDWPRVASITGILVVAYLLATLIFLLILLKSGIHRVIRIGDE